jgi:hypothetical protein
MSQKTEDPVEAVLENVKSSRRDLLKRLLVGAGAMALMVPMSTVLANAQGDPPAKSKSKGKTKGKAKPKAKGKAKGKGKSNKGKSKAKGKGTAPAQ